MIYVIRNLFVLTTFALLITAIGGCASTSSPDHFNKYQTSLKSQLTQRGVQTICIGNTVTLILPTDTFFYPQSYDVSEYNQYTLQMVAELITNYGNMPITITAYSDTIGRRSHQLKLTKEQANVIASYLWSHGIVDQNMRIYTGGWKNTIASNLTPNGMGYNRRIEISFQHP